MYLRVLSLIILAAATVTSAAAQKGTTAVKTGSWSSETAIIEVEKGSVKLDFGCSAGTIPVRLRVDRHGNFRVKGTYVSGLGGANPPPGMGPREQDVFYSGTVKGNRMTIAIDFPNSERVSPSYEVKREKPKRALARCA